MKVEFRKDKEGNIYGVTTDTNISVQYNLENGMKGYLLPAARCTFGFWLNTKVALPDQYASLRDKLEKTSADGVESLNGDGVTLNPRGPRPTVSLQWTRSSFNADSYPAQPAQTARAARSSHQL